MKLLLIYKGNLSEGCEHWDVQVIPATRPNLEDVFFSVCHGCRAIFMGGPKEKMQEIQHLIPDDYCDLPKLNQYLFEQINKKQL